LLIRGCGSDADVRADDADETSAPPLASAPFELPCPCPFPFAFAFAFAFAFPLLPPVSRALALPPPPIDCLSTCEASDLDACSSSIAAAAGTQKDGARLAAAGRAKRTAHATRHGRRWWRSEAEVEAEVEVDDAGGEEVVDEDDAKDDAEVEDEDDVDAGADVEIDDAEDDEADAEEDAAEVSSPSPPLPSTRSISTALEIL
jgi:hypothetical protein